MKKISPLLDKLKKVNRTQLLIAGLFGILLLVIALPTEEKQPAGDRQKAQEPAGQTEAFAQLPDTELSYQKQIEEQLEEVLGKMEGVGQVSVMITLKDSGETQVEKDITRTEEKSAEGESQGVSRQSSGVSLAEETVFDQGEGSSQNPFIKKVTVPQVEGVLVVAQGAGNAAVVKNISDAILALFPVEAHKIKVVRMQSGE
ncbi:MAG: stage III sporulation protein AG [Lachnospiraceae bacterium]|nr:stage III sporulation protein AG [Lachnospiraceae bacterium]